MMFAEFFRCLIGEGQLHIGWMAYLFRIIRFDNVVMNYTGCN
jgi:hypothetical protein